MPKRPRTSASPPSNDALPLNFSDLSSANRDTVGVNEGERPSFAVLEYASTDANQTAVSEHGMESNESSSFVDPPTGSSPGMHAVTDPAPTSGAVSPGGGSSSQPKPEKSTERKAVHNALERKRRDHIKDMFVQLRYVVPTIEKDKASRAEILRKSTDFINNLRRKNDATRQDIALMKRSVDQLQVQLDMLEQNGGTAQPVVEDGSSRQLLASENTDHDATSDRKRQRTMEASPPDKLTEAGDTVVALTVPPHLHPSSFVAESGNTTFDRSW